MESRASVGRLLGNLVVRAWGPVLWWCLDGERQVESGSINMSG